ncbi:hypothetical protein D3C78_1429980 [compost metagenome]
MAIIEGIVFEAGLDQGGCLPQGIDREVIVATGETDAGGDHVIVVELEGVIGVIGRAHHLVQLLAWANADDLLRQLRRHGAGQIGDAH